MTQENTNVIQRPRSRLKFIDMARSIAILLMLEGHFVDQVLDPIYRDPNSPVYATWYYIRGFTAPMFLTVTGIVFVYLLLNSRHEAFFGNVRIKKGFKRVLELIFWGTLLQYYAFHVLQCIAFGILGILLIYGLYKLLRVIPLWIYFFCAGTFFFIVYLLFVNMPADELWPKNTWSFIQNMFHGPKSRSLFPIIPWMGYTMYGAMIGALLHDLKDHVRKWRFAFSVVLIGAILFMFSKVFLNGIEYLLYGTELEFFKIDYLYFRLGMILMILGALMMIEKILGDIRQNLFLKIGQNTLTIYIIHMMILYGSVIRIGVNDFYDHDLNPWESTFGAVLFLGFFILLIYYFNPILKRLDFILGPIRRFWSKVYHLKD